MLDLLALTADQLHRAARAAFGASKGAGLAGALHGDACCHGRFEPERHGLGPRAAELWRRLARLELPAVRTSEQETLPTGVLTKRLLGLTCGRAIESVHLPVRRRQTKGRSVMATCGQLAGRSSGRAATGPLPPA